MVRRARAPALRPVHAATAERSSQPVLAQRPSGRTSPAHPSGRFPRAPRRVRDQERSAEEQAWLGRRRRGWQATEGCLTWPCKSTRPLSLAYGLGGE